MSIHQPIQLPVSVFSSSDADAPQLSPSGAAGEIKTILKACLITGYGSTAAQAGWAMPFEDGNKAVFHSSDPRATGFCLRIDHSSPKKGEVACYESMTDIDTGINEWLNQPSGFIFYNTTVVSWDLVATNVGFILIVNHDRYNSLIFSFGDMQSTLVNDSGNCFVFAYKAFSTGSHYSAPVLTNDSRAVLRAATNWDGAKGGCYFTSRKKVVVDSSSAYEGHIGLPDPLYNGNVFRAIPPWLVSDKREGFHAKTETLHGREYLVVSAMTSGFVYFIPLDYWLL